VSLVIDSSITLAWFFEDERSDAAEAVLHQVAGAGAIVPALWRLEVANGLQMAVRRARIDAAFRDASLADLRALPIAVDPETDHQAWTATLKLADRCRLTLYDAAYLELAQRVSLPLATFDQELRAAAGSVGVTLLIAE
jgi:predicted nucleic acid-binding protein